MRASEGSSSLRRLGMLGGALLVCAVIGAVWNGMLDGGRHPSARAPLADAAGSGVSASMQSVANPGPARPLVGPLPRGATPAQESPRSERQKPSPSPEPSSAERAEAALQ